MMVFLHREYNVFDNFNNSEYECAYGPVPNHEYPPRSLLIPDPDVTDHGHNRDRDFARDRRAICFLELGMLNFILNEKKCKL